MVFWTVRLLVLAILLTLVAGHPWGVAWFLEHQLAKAGNFSAKSREVSYRRIVWQGVEWQGGEFRAETSHLELGLLPRFWESWTQEAEADEDLLFFATANAVKVKWEPSTTEPNEAADSGAVNPRAWVDRLHEGLTLAEQWIPPIQLREVSVETPEARVEIPVATWDGALLRVHAENVEGLDFLQGWSPRELTLETARVGSGMAINLVVDTREFAPLRIRSEVTPETGDRTTVELGIESDYLEANAEIAWQGMGWRPASGKVDGRAAIGKLGVRLPEGVTEIDSTFHGNWEGAEWSLHARQRGSWSSEDEAVKAIPLELAIEASGDEERVEVKSLRMNAPWAEVSLDQPVTLDWKTLTPEAETHLRWKFEAGQEAALPLTGKGEGIAEIAPRRGDEAGLSWGIEGSVELDFASWLPEGMPTPGAIRFSARGEGGVDSVCLAESHFETDAWGEIDGKGCWERGGASEGLTADLEGIFRASIVQFWLPEGLELGKDVRWTAETTAVDASSEDGSAPSPRWNVAVELPEARYLPLNLSAALEVNFRGLSSSGIQHWEVDLAKEDNELHAEGASDWSGNGQWSVKLDELVESFQGDERWKLGSVATVRGLRGEGGGRRLQLDRFALRRTDEHEGGLELAGAIDLRSGEHLSGRITLSLHNGTPESLAGWWEPTNRQWSIESLELELALPQSGNATGMLRTVGTWEARDGSDWRVKFDGEASEGVLAVNELSVGSRTAPWFEARGRLPMAWRWEKDSPFSGTLRVDRSAPLEWHVALTATEPLPPYFAESLSVAYDQLKMEGTFGGSFSAPEGDLSVSGNWVEYPIAVLEGETKPLRLEDLSVVAKLENGSISVSKLGFHLPGASGRAEAQLHLQHPHWENVFSASRLDWIRQLDLQVALDAFPLAAVGPILPDLLEPTGTVTADIKKVGTLDFEGKVSWEGLQLRPLPNGMAPRDFRGTARLDGRALREIEADLSVSGRALRLGGEADFSSWPDPLFDLSLDAERLDLTRQLDLILRASGSLHLVHSSPDAPPRLSGKLQLLDSLLLRDLRDFTQQGAAGVARRPPYFSVEAEPFRDWQLDISIAGERFMRVRTPIFHGNLSADVHLGGTLGDPVAIGQVEVEEGSIDFPFASLPMQRGLGTITLDAPHRLQLEGRAQGIAFGYDVSVELSGTASEPEILFGSSQGLPQDEVLLMLTAGSVPSSDEQSSDSMRAGRLALFLGRDVFSTLLSESGDASKIEVRSTEGVSPFRKETQVIEYHFTDDWSVLGEYDDFGDYNVDAKWTIYRK